MAQTTMTPARVAAIAEAKAQKVLDEAPPVADPVHSLLAGILVVLDLLCEQTPNAHLIQQRNVAGLKAALGALTAPPK